MDVYDVLMLIALAIFILSAINHNIILPRIRRKAAEEKARRRTERLNRRLAGTDGSTR
jgi:lipopolysaccharide export LptBFGC system permease protein LptF